MSQKVMMQDSYRQFIEKEALVFSKKKEALQAQLERMVVAKLRTLGCEGLKLSKQTDLNISYDENKVNGVITVFCSGIKNKMFDITVKAAIQDDSIKLDEDAEILKDLPTKDVIVPLVKESSLKIEKECEAINTYNESTEKEKRNLVNIAEIKAISSLKIEVEGTFLYKEFQLYKTLHELH